MKEFKDLVGKTLASVEKVNDSALVFILSTGEECTLYHDQDCCESVTIEDITGNLEDLVGSSILIAEEVVHDSNVNPEGVEVPEFQDCFTWTFYKIGTIKGSVTIRWYGESNGYYSESVDFSVV